MLQTAWQWWTYAAGYEGYFAATRRLLGVLWEFVRDSTPERLRQRYGDADYDWDYRVNTTSGAVGWRDRLLGQFHSAYQPTEPAAFHEMLDALQQTPGPGQSTLNFRDFTFLDLGSGKGRTLLMAADYPFRRIVGVELLPALHQIAQENLRQYKSESQKCFGLEAVCADATDFPFPDGPLVIYLFNPFPEVGHAPGSREPGSLAARLSPAGVCALSQPAAGVHVEREPAAEKGRWDAAILAVQQSGVTREKALAPAWCQCRF